MKQSCRDVLELLRAHPEGVSPLMALDEIGCFRLGARVWDLKAAGHEIESRLVTTANGKRIAVYTLHEAPVQMAAGW